MARLRLLWTQDDGVLSFEWVLLVTILTIGIVSGIAAARDAIIDELGDVVEAAIALDQSYRVDYAPDITIHNFPAAQCGSDSQYTDQATQFNDCGRTSNAGQDAQDDGPA
jgi:hypothetical protein